MLPNDKLTPGTKLHLLKRNGLWSEEKYSVHYPNWHWPGILPANAPQYLPPITASEERLALLDPGSILTVQGILYEANRTYPSEKNPGGAAYQCIRATVSVPSSAGSPQELTGFIYITYTGVEYAALEQEPTQPPGEPDAGVLSVSIEAGKVTLGQVKLVGGKLTEYTKIGEQPTDDIPNHIWVSQHLFTPPRYGNEATFYVDGEDAMAAMAEAMSQATKSIHITGWWISPDIIMSPSKGSLKTILQQMAGQGISVKVLLYDPPDIIGLGLDEDLAENTLEQLAPAQIHVVRTSPGILWTHHQKTVIVDEKIAFLGGVDLARGRRDTHRHQLESSSTTTDNYYNPQVKNATPSQNIRMPWHDIHVRLIGAATRDVALNFARRWNSSLRKEQDEAVWVRSSDTEPLPGTREWNLLHHPARSIAEPSNAEIPAAGPCVVQIARTFGLERGIEEMYVKLIGEAKTYIHIEQQFFTSLLKAGNTNLNKVVSAICDRLDKAILNHEEFRVYIIIPQYPEGILDQWKVQELMHWQYQTIIRGNPKEAGKEIGVDSLYGRGMRSVRAKDSSASTDACMTFLDRYVKFFNLVRCERVGDRLAYSQIYVHAKMMIVDDRYAIIGSANINDRSLLGDRDTEIAALIADRAFARDLRVRLWKEHLGLLEPSGWTDPERGELESLIEAPPSAQLHERILQIARANTTALEATFPDFPRDALATLKQQEAAEALPPGDGSALNQLRGHLTLFPLYWLRDEDLETTGYPDEVFSFNAGASSTTPT